LGTGLGVLVYLPAGRWVWVLFEIEDEIELNEFPYDSSLCHRHTELAGHGTFRPPAVCRDGIVPASVR
jgi:hypothetical protein